jgi:hypothetical protein
MRPQIFRKLLSGLGLSLSLVGAGHAASTAIYQREGTDGAVELSNVMVEEDGQVVVAPAGAEAPLAAPAPTPTGVRSLRAALKARAAAADGTADGAVSASDEVTDPLVADGAASGVRQADAQPARDLGNADARPTASSNYGASAYAPGAPNNPQTSGQNANDTVVSSGHESAAAASGLPTAAPSTAPTTVATAGPPETPEALAARWAAYRDLMVLAPRLANGQAENPAVQRRYLMVNRGNFQAAR